MSLWDRLDTRVYACVIVVALLLFGYDLLGDVLTAMQSTAWPKTQGYITESFHSKKGSLISSTGISYEYTVNGVKYSGTTPLSSSPSIHVTEIAAYYRNHPLVEVFYDPSRPSRSYIEPGFSWSKHGIPLVLYCGFVGGFLWWWSRRSKKYAPAYTEMKASSSRQQTAEIYGNTGGQHAAEVYGNTGGQHVQFQSTEPFALEKNAASMTTLIIMASVFAYAVADGLFINPLEVVGYPKNILLFFTIPFTTICLLAAAIYLFMILSSVPAGETSVLTMLFVLSLIIATLPLLQRIDTSITNNSMQYYDYRITKDGVFEPVNKDLPKLKFKINGNYWKQFGENHNFIFLLQQGGLGLWQFDGRALDKDIEAYMKRNPLQRKSKRGNSSFSNFFRK